MRLSFKPITIEDKELITSYTMNSEYQNCDFAFANICSWKFLYDSEYTEVDGFLLVRFRIENKKRAAYMCPVGCGELEKIINLLEEDSLAQGHPLLLLGVSPESKADLERAIPGGFHHIPDRDYFDYIYLREDLVTLSGKKYQSKRNHINRFKNLYNYEYRPITPEMIPECLKLESIWYKANKDSEDENDLSYERRSMIFALNHFDELGLSGGALCVEGTIAAFTFGSPINHNTFGVHVEKADVNFDGAYSVINQEFSSRIPEQYIYVNREEDLGIPGLRQAKLSYQPAYLLEKNATVKKNRHK